METKSKMSARSNTVYLGFLIAVILVLSVISLIYKFITLWQTSTYTTPSFNVLVIERDAHVVHVDNVNKQVSIFTIEDAGSEIEQLTDLGASLTFRVPIDARVVYESDIGSIDTDYLTFKNTLASLFNMKRAEYSHMNSADILKMYIAARNTPEDNKRHVTVSKEFFTKRDSGVEPELEELFRDETIFGEKLGVEVVNATGIGGFGARMGRTLENAGYNVISVKNGISDTSYIVNRANSDSETLRYLTRFLRFPVKSGNSPPVADISIIFGVEE